MSTNELPPEGMLYTALYVERGTPCGDSPRARARISHYISSSPFDDKIAATIRLATGEDVYSSSLKPYLRSCPLADFLNIITHVYRCLPSRYVDKEPNREWLLFAQLVFQEENLSYRIDKEGGVHPAPDKEFVVSTEATIAGLSGARHQAVRAMFEKALIELKNPSQTSSAIRHAFEACENLFKLMFECSRLGETEIEKQLKPYVLSTTTTGDRNAASAMVTGMKSWVTASHQFRHAPGTEAHEPASMDIALLMISSAAAYIRWLASLDQQSQEGLT